MKLNQIYFDCNATTPTWDKASKKALEIMQTTFGNPSSHHLAGLQAKYVLENARNEIGKYLQVASNQIVFTSGATEAIQLSVFSAFMSSKDSNEKRKTVLYGATEHKAVPEALAYWNDALKMGFKILAIPVNSSGRHDLDFIKKHIDDTLMICTMAVNNETGVVSDLEKISEIVCKSHKPFWLVDSVQALGKLRLDYQKLGIDFAPFSGHKIYAPKGIGFLYFSHRCKIHPLIVGGGQEQGLRSGTENLPGVAALGEVIHALNENKFGHPENLKKYRDKIVKALESSFEKIKFHNDPGISVPTTINFSIDGIGSGELLDLFDSAGLRLSSGSACSAKTKKPSHVLLAMGLTPAQANGAIRLSFGPLTTEKEINLCVAAIKSASLALKGSCMLSSGDEFDAPENLRDGVIQLREGPSNCWIVVNKQTKAAVIIDPLAEVAERIQTFIGCQGLKLKGIMDTHTHVDHESCREILTKMLASSFDHTSAGDELGWPIETSSIKVNGKNYPSISLGETEKGEQVIFKVPTPGHTEDSRCYILANVKGDVKIEFIFCGDTIITGGLGRTNFVSSNIEKLFSSLKLLKELAKPTTVLCAAHDYINSFGTSFAAEMNSNKLMGLVADGDLKNFVKEKELLDRELENLERDFSGVVCGVTYPGKISKDVTMTWEELRKRANGIKVIDVRESQEHSVFKGWKDLGLKEEPQNVPLSRIVNLMGRLLSHPPEQDVVLICRSGNRSGQAAQALRRMGIQSVYSLAGGFSKA